MDSDNSNRTLEQCVRQCVREELRRLSSAHGQQGSLIQRTRQLIATSVTVLSRGLVGRSPLTLTSPRSASVPVEPIATATSNNLQAPLSLGAKRANVHVPGHNLRYKKKGRQLRRHNL